MNDELAEPTEPEPAPTSAPASPDRHTITVDSRLAAAAAAVVLVLLSGAVGFAIGRSTADNGSDLRFPADGFSHGWGGPAGGSRNPGWGGGMSGGSGNGWGPEPGRVPSGGTAPTGSSPQQSGPPSLSGQG